MLSNPIEASLLPQVAFDSSIAKIPLPGEAIVFYFNRFMANHNQKNHHVKEFESSVKCKAKLSIESDKHKATLIGGIVEGRLTAVLTSSSE